MTPERWRKVEELYHSALEREPAERAAFLAEACDTDDGLRREVESLLEQQSGDGPLARPAWERAEALLESTVTQIVPGEQLGPYKIEASIGAGGMGEVFKARDTRLGRAVAIKITDKQFIARFEREARAISALNHPHICTLYDVGPNYLVMELCEGETLAARLKRGKCSIQDTLRYGAQIADALSAAHAKGIVHRDLKPGNIMIVKSGVKVLDFGLAKSEQDATMTARRVVMGTPAYMAPEQREGEECDARTDIYSLGLVLYEMATGKRAVQGQIPPMEHLPPQLGHIIERCVAHDLEDRWQSARDLMAVLEWAGKLQPAHQATAPRKNRRWLWNVAAALLILAGAWTVSRHQSVADLSALRVEITPPEGGRFSFGGTTGGIALSPDGKTAAYVATANGKNGLWLRSMDSNEAKLLPGTSDAAFPFWSPDSKSIAYFVSGSRLERIDLVSGTPVTVCDVPVARGGTWSSSGSIVFGTLASGLFEVPASGGTPSPLTHLDEARGETYHNWPQLLPGNRILYWVQSQNPENTGVYVASLAKPAEQVKLLTTDTNALYAPGADGKNYLVWLRNGTLLAQLFDLGSLRLTGESHVLADPVGSMPSQSYMNVTASANGLLLYSPTSNLRQLTWFDRNGKPSGTLGEPGQYDFFRLAPDGRRLVAERNRPGGSDLWLLDIDRGVASRLTNSPGVHVWPVWSPDGRMILFSRSARNMFVKEITGTAEERRLTQSPKVQNALDWSHDGHTILFYEIVPETQRDLWILPVSPDGKPTPDAKPRPYLRTPFNEWYGRLSPESNPRWVAFESDESGRYEVYVDAFPEPRGKVRISTGGGRYPQWGQDGRELFYVSSDDKLMVVGLTLGAAVVEPSAPHELFQLPPNSATGVGPYEAAADGQRFLVRVPTDRASTPLTLIVNWPALLGKGSP